MADYTKHQKKIIQGYYDNRDDIMLAKLGELVTELVLADSEAKVKRLWSRVEKALKGLKLQPATIAHILKQQKPEILASHLRDLQSKKR
ncbi:MAG: hypothetical protein AABZ47_11965 [Planctomycetota bacterium]